MDGDDDPCFNIVNYKKVGNKETFNLNPKEAGDDKYSVSITLKDNKAVSIVMKGSCTYTSSVSVKTEKRLTAIWPITSERKLDMLLPLQ